MRFCLQRSDPAGDVATPLSRGGADPRGSQVRAQRVSEEQQQLLRLHERLVHRDRVSPVSDVTAPIT